MKKIRQWVALGILLSVLCAVSGAMAVPAFPGLMQLQDPATGEIVQGYLHGDEFFSYRTDAQGHVIVTDGAGCLRYVILDGSRYALGGYLIAANGDTAIGGTPVMAGDEGLESGLRALEQEIQASRPATFGLGRAGYSPLPGAYDYNDRANNDALYGKVAVYDTYPTAEAYAQRGSSIPLLLICVNYSDVQCCFSETEWSEKLFSEQTGLPAFYKENSDGKFTYRKAQESGGIANDGVVTAQLPITCPVYDSMNRSLVPGVYHGTDGREYAIFDVPMLFAYAVAAVEEQVDFASYDTNGDGRIDPTELAIMIALPGLNASVDGFDQADGQPGAWPHSSVIYYNWFDELDNFCYDILRVRVDGVEVYKYTMTVENAGAPATGVSYRDVYDYYTRTGTPVMTPIGTACHELGHDLGLADLYNTGGIQTTENVNGMSLMGTGSWGYREGEMPGTTPTHIDPYGKVYLGFYEARELKVNGSYSLAPAADAHHYSILRIPTDDPKVYYLVENRQLSGFDEGLTYEIQRYLWYGKNDFQGGLVIWSIDEQVLEALWWDNAVNNLEGNYGIMPKLFYDDPQLLAEQYPEGEQAARQVSTSPLRMSGSRELLTQRGSPFLKAGMKPLTLALGAYNVTLTPSQASQNGTVTVTVEGYVEPELPQTGDTANPVVWLCLLMACGLLLAVLGRRQAHAQG
ncbi:MAG: M6 family metalloprotease domain-containing protein [Aristaeellaceae bacterium]